MQFRNIIDRIRPYSAGIVLLAAAGIVVYIGHLTQIDSQWIAFLIGVLFTAGIAETIRVSHVESVIKHKDEQLSELNLRLDHEAKRRLKAENAIATNKPKLHLLDEVLPTMVAHIDPEGHCQYHNRAFSDWLNLKSEHIHGRHVREILGENYFQATYAVFQKTQKGQAANYVRTQEMSNGAAFKLVFEHLPQLDRNGEVNGFFMLINDITSSVDDRIPAPLVSNLFTQTDDKTLDQADPRNGSFGQEMFVDSFSSQISGQHDKELIMSAIEKGKFRLLSQLIVPLPIHTAKFAHREVLVRLMEEEESMIPPDAFFPLAEQHGLMPHLDRWVIKRVIEWISIGSPPGWKQKGEMFFINLSGVTITDIGFQEFLRLTLQDYDVPGETLCFELADTELVTKNSMVAEFIRETRKLGCRVAISGFGRDKVLFDELRGIKVDYLKLDGSIIIDLLYNPVHHAKVISIIQVARMLGVKTIAEMVESKEIVSYLAKTGIDFVEGYGISRPKALK